jgi:hypothetical protein
MIEIASLLGRSRFDPINPAKLIRRKTASTAAQRRATQEVSIISAPPTEARKWLVIFSRCYIADTTLVA